MQRKIIVVGEFLSQRDQAAGGPFKDGLGKMLMAMLSQAGISPRECLFTNVIMEVPRGRPSPFSFCGTKDQGIEYVKPLKPGKYIRAEFKPHVDRLWKLIAHEKPNLVIALGDLALWALTSEKNMKFARGRIVLGHAAIPETKILPTWSPRQIQSDYKQRPVAIADLTKAAREAEFPEVRRPQRFIHLYPSLKDLEEFYHEYITPSPYLDVDIETKGTMITCVGFAPTHDRAIVVPFFDEEQEDGNYWRTQLDEYRAWGFVRRMLSLGKSVCGQNFQYDVQYFLRKMGIPVPDFRDDTMLMHHALQPEMEKGLGFLASIYTDELPWKFMHKTASNDKTGKKED